VTGHSDLRILLVEDELLNRELVRAVLSHSSRPALQEAELLEAVNLAEARAMLSGAQVDVVLLDVQLPDGSGLELAAELTARPGNARPAIIALTAGALTEQCAAALEAGCDMVLTKPYTCAQLEASLTDPRFPAATR
jgi:CheY-like chemotaxis protein